MMNSALPQPPAGASAPPPGPEAMRARSVMNWILLGGAFSVALTASLFISPLFLHRSPAAGNRSQAIINMQNLWLALMEFEQDYGRFPDASTIAAVQAKTSTPLTLGEASSNQLLRQLLVTGLKSEKPFYAPIAGSRRVDDVFHDDAHALARGECGFAYIAGQTSDHPMDAPLLVSPLIPGTTRFDPKPFEGEAVVLCIGHYAKRLPIGKDGRVVINGMDLFDPRQPFWQGRTPDIKWSEIP